MALIGQMTLIFQFYQGILFDLNSIVGLINVAFVFYKRTLIFFEVYLQKPKHKHIFAIPIGDVAQLARALAWHARGRGFESHLLHPHYQRLTDYSVSLFCFCSNITKTF
jgi:hypothetical protein